MKKLTDGKNSSSKQRKTTGKSRSLLVAGLAVLVAVAGYYRYSVINEQTDETQTVAVMKTEKNEEKNYFTSARTERDKSRSEAEELVRKITEDDDATADAKADANNKLKETAETVRIEGEIEGLIKSKGYDDCIVFMEESEIRVIVKADKLEQKEVAKISDTVTSKADCKPSQVIISCHK